MNNKSYLQLTDLVKQYGDAYAVNNVNLDIKKGEFVSLLGPSGCGKSTTLMMIAGFESATAGAISIEGKRIDQLPPEKRNIGIVFQSYALFPHMTVEQNVEYGLKMRGIAPAERSRRVGEMLKIVHMRDFAQRKISQLSGGQQQRVALARALVIEPDLLLLDEPFSALDRKLREDLQRDVRHIQKSLGITTIFVTHDQEEALLMSDRIAVMNSGRIDQCAQPTTLYREPQTKFVANFIGRGNFVDGTFFTKHQVESQGAGAVLTQGSWFFRPEDVAIDQEKDSIKLAGQIDSIYFQGATQLAEVKMEHREQPLLVDVTQWARREALAEGGAMQFYLPVDRIRQI
ncbi:ABC transporter ATP-binding protein [Herbaspirillum sp. LeCh32-8]|uniref:ABC transporter ATP-binding protein n=1 Tax=Herbaspirillum sp. LeCh32-8 TaxID=2821356 RepID=UPI001AE5AE08|nr:ABC transporter ATP-binding protein [Herbaspirillum sp. LeCh32-8]MBP0598841.1 ABC transporter ATP-binding protein [Herbaspirillum sp. LeCh32-8]